MGMFPIFVVLACVILLWGMVNYSSFVTKRRQITDATAARQAAQLVLRDALLPLLQPSDALPTALAQPPDLTQLQRKAVVQDLLDEADAWLARYPAPAAQRGPYEVAKKAYFVARKKHLSAVNGYNHEVRHMPGKIIARLFNFRAV